MALPSKPLGWLAVPILAFPAAHFGTVVSESVDAPNEWWSAMLSWLAAAILGSVVALFVRKERRAAPLAPRIVVATTLGGVILGSLALLIQAPRWDVVVVGVGALFGALGGVAFGVIAWLLVALALRAHRGPRARPRLLLVAGLAWLVSLALRPENSVLLWASLLSILGGAIWLGWARRMARPDGDLADEPRDDEPAVRESLESRARGALLLVVPSYVLGLLVLERAIPSGMLGASTAAPLLGIAALVPALLGAGVGGWSRGAHGPGKAALRAFGASVLAGLVCAPLTFLCLLPFILSDTNDVAGTFFLVTFYGGIIGVPAGISFGFLFAATAALTSRLERGLLARPIARVLMAGSWIFASLLVIAIDLAPGASTQLAPTAVSGSQPWVPWLGLAIIVAAVATGTGPARELWRWLRLFRHAGRPSSDHDIVALEDLDGDGLDLEPLFPFGGVDAVLVRTRTAGAAPFREGTVSRPVGLVGLRT